MSRNAPLATIQYSNNGIEIRVTLRNPRGENLDLTGIQESPVGSVWFLIQKPSGDTTRRKCSILGNATDGVVQAILQSSDLDELGRYKIQIYAKTSTTAYNSAVAQIEVAPNIDVQF